MTPRQRMAFIESSLVIWDLLASYGNEEAGELAKALRAHGEDLDDNLVIRAVDKVLRVSAHELATMGQHLRAAVEMGSDYAAAFTAAQAEPASAANVARGADHVTRAAVLSSQRVSAPRIGIRLALEDDKVGLRRRCPGEPYSERTVRKWLSAAKKRGAPIT